MSEARAPLEQDEDPLEYCRENPDVVRELEEYASETGRDAFAAACRDALRQIEGDQS